MPNKKYIIDLTESERNELVALTSKGTLAARKMKRAQILLQADDDRTDLENVRGLRVRRPCVERVRQRFVEGGLPKAHNEAKRPGVQRKLDGRQEARLIAEACSAPLAGHARWTLRLMAGRVVTLQLARYISHETVRQMLKKTKPSPGSSASGVFPK